MHILSAVPYPPVPADIGLIGPLHALLGIQTSVLTSYIHPKGAEGH